ncbi:GNAT family N-acetyltransferase [Rhodoferax sp. BAB1]|uniref:GNAT family N-acetyltransferase n=1 Tax=Rhodoferax sp. BAB1 TaxID=2741720 RepID=UPI0015757AC3|nr:N-acetyltransferase [Rhodoferax sp. BAB1]QKO21143.1 N-acetyltransferase [Rhodoferax sp. BAB1]
MNLRIRDETTLDVPAITALTEAAFLNAPHTAHTEHFIVNALRRAGQLTLSLVAERDSVVVGHVALSPVTISDGAPGWYGLGPISVLPALQGQGIGSALMHAALDGLRARGAAGCLLVGDPAYYTRFGFKPVSGLLYPGIPPEYFMALAFGASLPQGSVVFHAAFEATA